MPLFKLQDYMNNIIWEIIFELDKEKKSTNLVTSYE